MSEDDPRPPAIRQEEILAMSSITNRTVFFSGASQGLAHATAQALANEFAQVIFLGDPAGAGCRVGGARSDQDQTDLHLDTNGRPLRDWDD
jgi:NAD(P)-dependent dehydrogenase (short-subunit alcohol dehydrogenase family)